MLDPDEIRPLISRMWILHVEERGLLDRIYDYMKGLRGRPTIPEEAEQEVKDLAKLAVRNVLPMIRDSFAQNLCVVGYRGATAQDNAPAWASWQRNRMDARQTEVYNPALTYGASYVAAHPAGKGPIWRPRSPRQLLAVYEDPQLDQWPQFALETWLDVSDAKPHRRGLLYDDTHLYPLDLGELPTIPIDPSRSMPIYPISVGDPIEHGATDDGEPVCPVVRFVNGRDADDMIVGEIAPLIIDQQAINSVNFDRLIVSRFGAFPQKVISGWSGTPSEVLKASAKHVWSFEDDFVKVQSLPAASVAGYNEILEEMMASIAMKAQISPAQIVGKLVNLSAEALAAAEANQQRKLGAKRGSFGESWEQVFRLDASMSGDTATAGDTSAEVMWADTEARSFATVVDGITKLVSAGIPVAPLLPLIPGLSQQQIGAIKDAMQQAQVADLVSQLRQRASQAEQNPTVADLTSRNVPAGQQAEVTREPVGAVAS